MEKQTNNYFFFFLIIEIFTLVSVIPHVERPWIHQDIITRNNLHLGLHYLIATI